jgi:nucleotide-binding universal stress UspA family protein
MSLRCLLVPIGAGLDPRQRLDAARALARGGPADIELLYIGPDPAEILATMPDAVMAGGITLDLLNDESRAATALIRAAFKAWKADAGLTGAMPDAGPATVSAGFTEQTGSIETVVALAGRLSDLIIVDRPARADAFAARVFDAAVFATGRPTLVVPPTATPGAAADRVLIAWNGSVEGARAVAQAMPLLHQAHDVMIFTAADPAGNDPACGDLVRYLARHGIKARALAAATLGLPVGEALLAAARSENASMIVMGAYTHSRVRQMFLGGVTRHVLHHADIPLLMSH